MNKTLRQPNELKLPKELLEMEKTMNKTLHEVELSGCSPTPLAHYLKALGILRLVSEQLPESEARGWWKNDTFILRSTLDADGLVEFFLNDYAPTPIVAPWNGGSGFYPKDNTSAREAILKSDSLQFSQYKDIILRCDSLLAQLGIKEKISSEMKPVFLQHCRNNLPDEMLSWLDAAYLLTADGPKYPPLLGTGGNDGRLEFTNNFMQHLIAVLPAELHPQCTELLEESLFASISDIRSAGTIGQFDPGDIGGANNGTGFEGASTVNAWDYIFMLEGAMAFAAASVKRLEEAEPGTLAYPFCVRTAGSGYESSSLADEADARAEMWMPLWKEPASYPAISVLLSEGRVETNRRRAKNGVDFIRAIASLGIDRGIDRFQRFGFQQRNGLAYFAVPLGLFDVRSNPLVEELLDSLDSWLDRFRRSATGKNAPASASRALRKIESAIFSLCKTSSSSNEKSTSAAVQKLLIALGEAEATMVRSPSLRTGDKGPGLSPIPMLSKNWILKADDGSTEFQLAASLASVWHKSVGAIRKHLEPFDLNSRPKSPKWLDNDHSPSIVWTGGQLIRNLNAILQRRLIEIVQSGKESGEQELLAPLDGKYRVRLNDINMFINERVSDTRIAELFRGLILVNWQEFNPSTDHRSSGHQQQTSADATYALFKLCHLSEPLKLNNPTEEKKIKLDRQISRRAISGDALSATERASRRLLASGIPPAVKSIFVSPERIQRVTASMLFPLWRGELNTLVETIVDQHKKEKSDENSGGESDTSTSVSNSP